MSCKQFVLEKTQDNYKDSSARFSDQWKANFEAALKGEVREYTEEAISPFEDSKAWIAWRFHPIYNGNNKVEGLVVYFEDISGRHASQIELKKVLARFELIQQAAEIGMWDWDIPGKHATLNAEFYDIIGWNLNEPLSYSDFLQLVHPRDAERVKNAMEAAVKNGDDYEVDFRIFRRKDGSLRWVRDKGRVDFSEDGAPSRAYGAIIDVTSLYLNKKAHTETERG